MAATRTPAPHGRSSSDAQVFGTLLIVAGVAWLLGQTGLLELPATTLLSVLLLGLGVGLVLTARSAGGGGLVAAGLVLTAVLASASAVDVGLLQRGVGDRTFRPTTAAALSEPFQLGVGSLTVDLSGLAPAELVGKRLDVQVGVGEVEVVLPPEEEVPVDLIAEARAGEVQLFSDGIDGGDGGTSVRRRSTDEAARAGARHLQVDLDVGLGSIQVVRAGT